MTHPDLPPPVPSPPRRRALRAALLSACLLASTSAACSQSVDVAQLQLQSPDVNEPAKSALPLHIVLDPNKIPASLTATGADQKPVTVAGLRAFVERDLQRALSSFFTTVDVVDPGFDQPGQWYLVAEVEISSLRLLATNGGKQLRGRMEWTFVLRAAGREQHIYQSSGTTGAEVGRGDGPGAIRATLEAALAKITSAYIERDIRGRVARLEQSLPRG